MSFIQCTTSAAGPELMLRSSSTTCPPQRSCLSQPSHRRCSTSRGAPPRPRCVAFDTVVPVQLIERQHFDEHLWWRKSHHAESTQFVKTEVRNTPDAKDYIRAHGGARHLFYTSYQQGQQQDPVVSEAFMFAMIKGNALGFRTMERYSVENAKMAHVRRFHRESLILAYRTSDTEHSTMMDATNLATLAQSMSFRDVAWARVVARVDQIVAGLDDLLNHEKQVVGIPMPPPPPPKSCTSESNWLSAVVEESEPAPIDVVSSCQSRCVLLSCVRKYCVPFRRQRRRLTNSAMVMMDDHRTNQAAGILV